MEEFEYPTKTLGHGSTGHRQSLEILKQGEQVKKQGFEEINQISHKKGCGRLEERANRWQLQKDTGEGVKTWT